jgi:glycosyltransferase involved in cell wall biosynthesis
MKIAFVSLMRILPWGGSEELWFRAAKLAVKNGHSVSTLTQRWSEIPSRILELSAIGVSSEFFHKPEYSLLERLTMRAGIKKRVPEVISIVLADFYVISNGTTFDFLDNTFIMTQIIGTGKPYLLISQHNFENGHIISESNRKPAVSILQKSLTNFFVSQRNLECAERQLAHKINNSIIISNPINITTIEVKTFPASETLLMACVARLDCSVKGQDILLEVLSTDQWRVRDFTLKFYGTGPHLDYLGVLIKFYRLENKVTIEGHVKDIDLIWENNQVFILPSLNEGTPLALIEAMLSGRAAVVTNVGDSDKYILEGQTGFLASAASVECLSASLEKLWLSKRSLQLMGVNAFNHAITITDLEPEKMLLSAIEQGGN